MAVIHCVEALVSGSHFWKFKGRKLKYVTLFSCCCHVFNFDWQEVDEQLFFLRRVYLYVHANLYLLLFVVCVFVWVYVCRIHISVTYMHVYKFAPQLWKSCLGTSSMKTQYQPIHIFFRLTFISGLFLNWWYLLNNFIQSCFGLIFGSYLLFLFVLIVLLYVCVHILSAWMCWSVPVLVWYKCKLHILQELQKPARM